MEHIYEARRRWKPLYNNSPHWDNRYLIDQSHHFWTECATQDKLPELWHPDFKPRFTPMFMLEQGIFGGAYFGDALGQDRAALLPPYGGQDICTGNLRPKYKTNLFGVKSGLKRDWWLDKGLIYNIDPLGWFEWFCWYWLGRRMPSYDAWQVNRWAKFGPRHKAQLVRTGGDGYRQALFQWSHDPYIGEKQFLGLPHL